MLQNTLCPKPGRSKDFLSVRVARTQGHEDSLFPGWLSAVPVGGSPTGAGESPALPRAVGEREQDSAAARGPGIGFCGGGGYSKRWRAANNCVPSNGLRRTSTPAVPRKE